MRINTHITILTAAIAVVTHSTNLLGPTLTPGPAAPALILRGSLSPVVTGGSAVRRNSFANDECLDGPLCGSAK